MIHLDDEQVQRLLHDELAPGAKASLKDHVEACRECQDRVAEARHEEEQLFGLLAQVDHPAPTVGVSAVMAPSSASPVLTRWAAAGLLAVGLAGAAYAMPGSPVRGWLRALGTRSTPVAELPVAPPAVPKVPVAGGVAVPPGRNFEVRFLAAQPAGEIRVTMSDGADLIVQARGEGASFTSSGDQLVIDNRHSSADFDIAIPRSAPRVEIRIGDRQVLMKEGSRIVPARPDSGPSRIPLTRIVRSFGRRR